MKQLIESIANKDFDIAQEMLEESLDIIVGEKLVEMKKMIIAKEQRQAWTGMPGSRQEKLYRDVIEEDELEEMDISGEEPDYGSIEDRRGQTPNVKAGQIWAKPHRKKMGVRVTQQQADDIRSGKMSGGSPFSSLDKKIQKTTGLQVGGARPGMTGKNSPSGSSFFQKQFQKEESEELDEARINIVQSRIRGGKIQRRKKVSNVPGMTIRGGKLTRMSPAERRRRKLGQRKGKIKRRAKMARALMKRRRSLQRRKSLGLGQ